MSSSRRAPAMIALVAVMLLVAPQLSSGRLGHIASNVGQARRQLANGAALAKGRSLLQNFGNCSDPDQGGSFLSNLFTGIVSGTFDEIPEVGFIVEALVDAFLESNAVSPNDNTQSCTLGSLQAWVTQYVQQEIDQEILSDVSALLQTYIDKTTFAWSLDWTGTEKESSLIQAYNGLWDSVLYMQNKTVYAPVQMLPYAMTFFPLQLAMQQYVTIANCSGMYGACDASNLQKNAIQLQGNINVALDTISSAISTAVSNRSAAVNPNLGSVKCGGPTGTGAANLQWCSWNMVDTWAAAPFTYAQQNAVVAPANLQYTTPQQYPAEYESMVAATLEAQLQAFTATSALWQLMDTSQNWTVANTTAMAPIGPFGMWAISNAQVVQAVQQQLQNPATAYSQTPGPGFPVSQSMLSTITLFEYDTTYSGVSTDQWQKNVLAVYFSWNGNYNGQPFDQGVLGDDSQFTNFYKLSLLSNEYIVSVNGVTGGLNLGIQFINFTTNLGRSLSAGTPWPGSSWNNMPGSTYSTNFPVTPFFMDFSGQPQGAEIWLCGAYTFNGQNSALNVFPLGGVRAFDDGCDQWDYWSGSCYHGYKRPALSTIGLNWCWNTYDVQPQQTGK